VFAVCISACTPFPGGADQVGSAGRLTIFAAASLGDAFKAEATDFQRQQPGSMVGFSFAGSATLAAQIEQGAPADVFASADTPTMERLAGAHELARGPVVFARNRLELAVAPGNPKHVNNLAGLTRPGLIVDLCRPEVPCGAYALEVLQWAGVSVRPVTEEVDVRAVLTRVELGEADAGLVYATDIAGAGGKVDGVAIAESQNVLARYPVAVLKAAREPGLASLFVDFLLSARGQQTLRRFGFLAP
jgi:molybdate transport system substrate-binding protein